MAVYVRVNAVPTEWFARDVAEGVAPEISGVIVPKLESPRQIETVVDALERAGLGHLHLFAGIETAQGVESARELFQAPVRVAYFGAEDYIADMGGVRTPEGTEVLYARSRVALAARLGGVFALDQVVTALDDEEHFLAARSGSAASCASTRRRSRSPTGRSPPPRRRSTARNVSSPHSTRQPRAARPPSRSRVRWSTSHSPATPARCSPPPPRPDRHL